MAALTLTLLGCFQARVQPGSFVTFPKKTQALLAYLGLRPGQAHRREHLAALLWGETGEKQAYKSLRQAMYVLHKSLPATKPPILVARGGTIALDPTVADVDVADFEGLLAEGTPAALERAAALYHGDLLEGLNVNEAPFDEWLTAERERLRELALETLRKVLAHQTGAGLTANALQTAVRLLGFDPLQEDVHRTLMRLYAEHGRCGAALKQYQVCVAALQRELGAEPEPETKQLYQEMLQRRLTGSAEVAKPGLRRSARRSRLRLEVGRERIESERPLVGREAELARLNAALYAAARGRGQVVAIVGEAGIGKSSVLSALAAEARSRGMRIMLGHAYESEQVLAFGPWVAALRGGQLLEDRDIVAGLTAAWREALVHLVPELGDSGQDPAASPPDHLRLFEAVNGLVRYLATREPVVVMLEDIHWADEMSGRLVAFMARRIRTARAVVAVTVRDDELASAPLLRRVVDELGREPHFVQLTLSPLTRADTSALVRSLAGEGSLADDIANADEQIWRASEGNPFMVVETVRALQEGTAPQTAAALAMPERVQRVVAGRLERLSQRGRYLASVAAVIGRECEFGLLQRAAALDDREAAEGVEELVRRRVLHGVGERFDFTHERIREVAYGELIQPRRKVLHVMVANALEELNADDLELHHATLAAHYRAAEVWDKALTHFREAGARAMRLSAYREAATCFEQAIEALARLPETRENLETAVDLRFALRNSLLPLAELDKIHGCLVESERLARTLDDRRRLGWLSVYMSDDLRTAGRPGDASVFGETAQGLGESLGDGALRLDASLSLGAAYLSLGDFRRAAESFRRIIRSLDDDRSQAAMAHLVSPAVLSRAYLAQALAELGEFAEGVAWGEEGVRIGETLDNPLGLAYACMRLGRVHRYKGELEPAAGLLERSHRLSQDWQITFAKPIAAGELGLVYALMGRVAQGLALLRTALDAYAFRRREVGKPHLLVRFGEACLLGGRVDEARAHADEALTQTCARGGRADQARALRLLGEIASHRDGWDPEAGEAHFREAIALALELGMRPLLARCNAGLGLLYRRCGNTHLANQHVEVAANMFRELHMAFWLQQLHSEVVVAR